MKKHKRSKKVDDEAAFSGTRERLFKPLRPDINDQ
jgi:hypothetical protein